MRLNKNLETRDHAPFLDSGDQSAQPVESKRDSLHPSKEISIWPADALTPPPLTTPRPGPLACCTQGQFPKPGQGERRSLSVASHPTGHGIFLAVSQVIGPGNIWVLPTDGQKCSSSQGEGFSRSSSTGRGTGNIAPLTDKSAKADKVKLMRKAAGRQSVMVPQPSLCLHCQLIEWPHFIRCSVITQQPQCWAVYGTS